MSVSFLCGGEVVESRGEGRVHGSDDSGRRDTEFLQEQCPVGRRCEVLDLRTMIDGLSTRVIVTGLLDSICRQYPSGVHRALVDLIPRQPRHLSPFAPLRWPHRRDHDQNVMFKCCI